MGVRKGGTGELREQKSLSKLSFCDKLEGKKRKWWSKLSFYVGKEVSRYCRFKEEKTCRCLWLDKIVSMTSDFRVAESEKGLFRQMSKKIIEKRLNLRSR